ncbi:hypothetical protein BpHYR1_010356 [Brachionus plicatilis]|uniref:Uncharacterized protein n=1 Tax=Brachionus plicatilis TaxID=10195 RepID=A0A3M7QCG7_BRAPC|nr:hypothetical protein BpHYR1_010356 [Brachionus plicatilis]
MNKKKAPYLEELKFLLNKREHLAKKCTNNLQPTSVLRNKINQSDSDHSLDLDDFLTTSSEDVRLSTEKNKRVQFSQSENDKFGDGFFEQLKKIIEKVDPLEPDVQTIWDFDSFDLSSSTSSTVFEELQKPSSFMSRMPDEHKSLTLNIFHQDENEKQSDPTIFNFIPIEDEPSVPNLELRLFFDLDKHKQLLQNQHLDLTNLMSQKENFVEPELDIDEIDKKINRKNSKIKTRYVEELKEYLGKMKKDNEDANVSAKIFKKAIDEEDGESSVNNNEYRYSTISDEIDNTFSYLNDSSYSSDQDDTLVQENFLNFVKEQKDDDFYKELNKILEKYPKRPKYVVEPKVRSSLTNSRKNDQIEEEIFMNNYRKTLQEKLKSDEIDQEVKRVKVFFDWLATNHGIYLFKKKENNLVVNIFHPNASENKFADNPKSVFYKPVDEGTDLKNLELKIYFDSKKYKNLLDIDQLDLFLTDPDDSEMLKTKKGESEQETRSNDEPKEKVDEQTSENTMFSRLHKINPFKRMRSLNLTQMNVFRQKK